MCGKNGSGGVGMMFGISHIYLLIFYAVFIIDLFLGVYPVIFTLDPQARAQDMQIYVTELNSTQYSQTLFNGIDYFLVRTSPLAILAFAPPLMLDMIDYKNYYIYPFTTAFFFLFGFVPDLTRSIWYIVKSAGCQSDWLCKVWYGPFIVLFVCALVRFVLGVIWFCDAFALRQAGRMEKDNGELL